MPRQRLSEDEKAKKAHIKAYKAQYQDLLDDEGVEYPKSSHITYRDPKKTAPLLALEQLLKEINDGAEKIAVSSQQPLLPSPLAQAEGNANVRLCLGILKTR